MKLLQELITLTEEQSYSSQVFSLFEDLGKLKALGLGRMVNAFKQTYHGRGRNERMNSSAVGNKINHQSTGIGSGSESEDVGIVKGWNDVKKAYKKNEEKHPTALVLYLKGKAVVLMVSNQWDIAHSKNVVGVSWDLTGVANDEQVKQVAATLYPLRAHGEMVDDEKSNVPAFLRKKPDPESKAKSAKTMKSTERDYGVDWNSPGAMKEIIRHYQGVAQHVSVVGPFINALAKEFGTALTGRLIFIDKKAQEIRKERSERGHPVEPKDVKLFTDDVKTRLAKFKASKLVTVGDVQEFIDKVFAREGLKQINFAGNTYSAAPEREQVGSSGRHQKEYKTFYNGTMNDLFKGREVSMKFTADGTTSKNKYDDLYLWVKLDGNKLIPTKAKYADADGKRQEVKFKGE